MNSIKYKSRRISAPTRFGTGVPSSGTLTKTKEHKSNTPVQVLIVLTVIIKILKYYIIILNIRNCTNMSLFVH